MVPWGCQAGPADASPVPVLCAPHDYRTTPSRPPRRDRARRPGDLCSVATRAGAAVPSGVSVTPSAGPAFGGDAPDPDVVLVRVHVPRLLHRHRARPGTSRSCATPCRRYGSPATGWRPCSGFPDGASALPDPPSWEALGTQNAPGVYHVGRPWIMFYTAAPAGFADDTGHNCLSVATTDQLGPTDPTFTDTSTGPLLCDSVARRGHRSDARRRPHHGAAVPRVEDQLRGAGQPAQLWSVPLGPDGTTPTGAPALLQTQDTVRPPVRDHHREPPARRPAGRWYLLFSAGIWDSASYGEVAVRARDRRARATSRRAALPHLVRRRGRTGRGDAVPGRHRGVAAGLRRLVRRRCTSYRCGGARRLFVAPASV